MKLFKTICVLMFFIMLIGCLNLENEDSKKDVAPIDDTLNNDDNEPYLQFQQISNHYYMDSFIVVSTFKGPFDIHEAKNIVETHVIETENMEQVKDPFEFSSLGFDPFEYSESLSFKGTYYVVNYEFQQDGDEVIIRVISVLKDLYYLPNQIADYLDLMVHPRKTDILFESVEGSDVHILARSEKGLSDIMNHYLSHFSNEKWIILSDSLNDASNDYYESVKKGQIHLSYAQNDSEFFVWLNVSTFNEDDAYFKEDTLFIEITIEDVKQYLVD